MAGRVLICPRRCRALGRPRQMTYCLVRIRRGPRLPQMIGEVVSVIFQRTRVKPFNSRRYIEMKPRATRSRKRADHSLPNQLMREPKAVFWPAIGGDDQS